MSIEIEEKLSKIPVVSSAVVLLKKVKLPAFKGLSLYDLIEMYSVGIIQGTLSTRASAIAFSLFMALFPLIIFMVTLVPFVISYVSVGNADFDVEFQLFLESFLPNATGEYFGQIFQQIKDQKRGGLLSSSFILSIFLIANGVNSIFGGFQTSYHIKLTRNFFRQYLFALMVGLILGILIIIGFIVYIYFEVYVLGYLSEFVARQGGYVLEEDEVMGVQIAKILFFIILSYLTTAILYYFGTREGKQARFFSVGALMTTFLFLVTSYLFGIYVDEFARYNELYGALGGLLILMVFIWLNSNILLLGFELNASLNYLRKNYNVNDDNE